MRLGVIKDLCSLSCGGGGETEYIPLFNAISAFESLMIANRIYSMCRIIHPKFFWQCKLPSSEQLTCRNFCLFSWKKIQDLYVMRAGFSCPVMFGSFFMTDSVYDFQLPLNEVHSNYCKSVCLFLCKFFDWPFFAFFFQNILWLKWLFHGIVFHFWVISIALAPK